LPFQAFVLLVDLRNRIVHGKPQEAFVEKDASGNLGWAGPPIMHQLQNAKLVHADDFLVTDFPEWSKHTRFVTDILNQIATPTTAMWACKSAAGIVNGILNAVPNDFAKFKDSVELAYRQTFTI
jgi:hypothetical protein